MRLKHAFIVVFVSCAAQAIASDDLAAVHEWGTFTSVAGEDGSAIGWQPLSGPSDLPCFVHCLDQRNLKVGEYGTVRMETPVLYILPRSKVEALLPISLHPSAQQLVRVFVGRVELLSPFMKNEISAALAHGDVTVLGKYRRFLNAFLHELGDVPTSEEARQFLDNSYSQASTESRKIACSE